MSLGQLDYMTDRDGNSRAPSAAFVLVNACAQRHLVDARSLLRRALRRDVIGTALGIEIELLLDRTSAFDESEGRCDCGSDAAPNCSPSGGERSEAGAEPPSSAVRVPSAADRRPLWRKLLDLQGELSSAVLLEAEGHSTTAKALALGVARELERLGAA